MSFFWKLHTIGYKFGDPLEALAPDAIATANIGCYLQLEFGVRERGLNIDVFHVMELVARSYGKIIELDRYRTAIETL